MTCNYLINSKFQTLHFLKQILYFSAFTIIFCTANLPLFGQTWAEKTLAEMTLEEKLGQLFVAPACPFAGDAHWDNWMNAMETLHIGNVIAKQATLCAHVQFLNRLQSESTLPLLVTADAEWGLAMRIQDGMAFPKNRILGAMGDLDLIYRIGAEIARQAKRIGIHMNLAPVADVDNCPGNPVIGIRSFGSDPIHVAACVSAFILGTQSQGVLACAKHFPGHGDTVIDSHKALPLIPHTKERLDELELIPFRSAIQSDVSAIMSGHLLVPSIDPDFPASLSHKTLTGLLKNDLNFKGLIITDALNMKALSGSPEEIALAAFEAGSDLLLYGAHLLPVVEELLTTTIPRAYEALKQAVLNGRVSSERLDQSVLKILSIKERLGLHMQRTVSEENLIESLYTQETFDLYTIIGGGK